jgi:RND superfamily putative drug exporter
LGLGVGVLADALAVRMTLVPAVLALLGHKSWWLPRGLDRALANVDIEGASAAPVMSPCLPPPHCPSPH